MRNNRRDVDEYVAVVVARLDKQVAAISAAIQATTERGIAELPTDTRMVASLSASILGNVETILGALRDGIPAAETVLPDATFEYAKYLAQQDVPVSALVRAYRLGQRRMTELVFAELHAIDMDSHTRVAVIEKITTVLFEYVDWVSEKVVAAYAEERERRLEQQNSIRAMWVRDILSESTPVDPDVDIDICSATIRYPLSWHHFALIVWWTDTDMCGDELALLQQFTDEVAAAIETGAPPLFTAADRTSGWVWLPYRQSPGDIVSKVRGHLRARAGIPNIAMGAVGSGVEGFRRSHRQAQRARSAALARNLTTPVIVAATDSGLLASALLGSSVAEICEWVADVLGALASDTDRDARLRQVLRLYLRADSGDQAAARELKLSFDACNRFLEQAVTRRGRPIDDRVDVELALLACQWYGSAVLRPT